MKKTLAIAMSLLLLTALAPSSSADEYWSDHFVLLAEDPAGQPIALTLDFNRGTSGVMGRERVAEFVGQACLDGRWVDLQSGEYPYPGQDMDRLVGNGTARVHRSRSGPGWILDYDGNRARFRIETEKEVLLHVQRDDPRLTIRHLAAPATLEHGDRRLEATVFREQVRWRGFNQLVGNTPPDLYSRFDWLPMVSRRGDWWLLVRDPGQLTPPRDGPDHNWGVYRSPEGIIRPLSAEEFHLEPRATRPRPEGRVRPRGWEISLPDLGMQGMVHSRASFQDRFASGLFAVTGEMHLPGVGYRDVIGLVDHVVQ